jgi:hypothetical protein
MKKLTLISLLAAAALVLTGCATSGHGSVQLFTVNEVPVPPDPPIQATFSFSFACYAQNNNRVEGYLNWNDPTNGVRFSAILPETSVKVLTEGYYTTCKELKAALAEAPFSSGSFGYIVNQDGKRVGQAGILVMKPTLNLPCGDPVTATPGTEVDVTATDLQGNTYYMAEGCLDRGKIIFGPGQNGQ